MKSPKVIVQSNIKHESSNEVNLAIIHLTGKVFFMVFI